MSEPIKRSDMSEDEANEIEGKLKEMFPGFEIKFAGDSIDECPPEVIAGFDQLTAAHRDSLVNGTCADCGKKIPCDWPCEQLPDGWGVYYDFNDKPQCLVCSDCDEGEYDE